MEQSTYQLTPEQISSITDVELAFSTQRLLPPWEAIPESFKHGNAYTSLTEAMVFGRPMPDFDIVLHEGVEAGALNKCIRAHLQSFGPSFEHKIAGVGLMIASACSLVAKDGGERPS